MATLIKRHWIPIKYITLFLLSATAISLIPIKLSPIRIILGIFGCIAHALLNYIPYFFEAALILTIYHSLTGNSRKAKNG